MALHVLDEANRCLGCKKPMCQEGCPIHTNIPEVIRLLKANQMDDAGRMLFENNPLTTVCSLVCNHEKQCEGHCIRNRMPSHDPVHFSIIEDYISTTYANKMTAGPAPKNGMKAAVVGSGPAGLAAADQLNHRGHLVTVVERAERPGGLLMYGIPNMKLPKDVVQRRIDLMTDEGVTFVCGLDASDEATARRLMKEYDAVLLCCGAGEPRPLGLDTAGVTGVCYGTEYLKSAVERAQFGKEETDIPSAAGLDVVIIGTGDTASDCVATALRQGCRSVTQLVRRPRADYLNDQGQLPLDYAHEEAEAVFGTDPRRFGVQVQSLVSGEGALTAVVTTEGDTLPCQLLIGATGFAGCESNVCHAFGVEADKTVQTLPGSFSTGVEKVFAAGDMRRGQSLVVWGLREGRDCAAEVDRYLMGYTNL